MGKAASAVEFNKQSGQIILNTSSRPAKKKKNNTIIQSIEVAYYIARELHKNNEEDRHEKFFQLIKSILDEIL